MRLSAPFFPHKLIILAFALFFIGLPQANATTSLPFTLNMSEAVNVDTAGGTPRVAITVGSTTRYANYTSGSGSASLVFTYNAVAGDLDLDGITLVSPIELNGGTIKDLAGNDAALTFTLPNTSGVRINYPSLSLDFIADSDGRYTRNGTAYNNLSGLLTAAGGAFSRAAPATTYAEDSAGNLVAFAANTPRITDRGLLLEGSRANLIFPSVPVSAAPGFTLTTNYGVAPNGQNNATRFQWSATANAYWTGSSIVSTANTVYTARVYVKALSGTPQITISSRNWDSSSSANFAFNFATLSGSTSSYNGAGNTITNVSGQATALANGWYRISVTATHSAILPNLTAFIEASSGTGDVLVWGAQLEQGSFASSYIPTTTTAVTRSADVFHVAATATPQGTFYTEFITYTAPPFSTIMAYTNSSGVYAAGFGTLIRLSSANVAEFGGNCCGAVTGGTFSSGVTSRLAGSYDTATNRAAISANGGTTTFITNNDFTGTGTARLHLGALTAGGAQQSWGYLRRARIYPAAKSDAELQAMTQ